MANSPRRGERTRNSSGVVVDMRVAATSFYAIGAGKNKARSNCRGAGRRRTSSPMRDSRSTMASLVVVTHDIGFLDLSSKRPQLTQSPSRRHRFVEACATDLVRYSTRRLASVGWLYRPQHDKT